MITLPNETLTLTKYKKYTVFILFVHSFEDWMWNYCDIKVYLKTLMLGGIYHDSFQKNLRFN